MEFILPERTAAEADNPLDWKGAVLPGFVSLILSELYRCVLTSGNRQKALNYCNET